MTKIIEMTFPAKKISEYGSHERYVRKNHPYGAKTWWARRPLTAMRALVFATATDYDNSREDIQLIEKLANNITPSPDVLKKAKERIKKSFRDSYPRLIDFFSGGGGIPLEAARLGIKSYSLELNPVAIVLQKAILEGKQHYPEIAKDVSIWGKAIIENAERDLAEFFVNPLEKENGNEEPIVYFWSRMVKCPHCKLQTPLSRLSYLARRNNRSINISFDSGKGAFVVREDHDRIIAQTKKNRNNHKCAYCSKPITSEHLKTEGRNKQIGETLQAIAFLGSAYQGKRYASSSDIVQSKLPTDEKLLERMKSLEECIDIQMMKFPLKEWSGIVNPTVYGYLTVEQLFNKRQLLVLLTLVQGLRNAHLDMINTGIDKQRADLIILILTSLVDHLADWNSSFTMWIPQNEQCGRSLAGPGIPMLWDYVEINPFGSGPANIRKKLNRIVESIESIPKFDFPIEIKQGSALKLPYPDKFFNFAIIDPPYHDSLFYSALSDCFFPWQKMVLEGIALSPNILVPLDIKDEVVASKHRHKNSLVASNKYEAMITKALEEACRVLKPNGLLTMVYSHKTIEGWETIANAIRKAGLTVVKAWPLYMERKARPRAMKSDALSSVVALVMHKRVLNNDIYFTENLKNQIEQELRKHFALLSKDGWLGTDILIACIGQSLVHFTSGSNLVESSGKPIDFQCYLKEFERILNTIVYSEGRDEIVKKIDIQTQIYLAWRCEYGEDVLTEDKFKSLCQRINEEIDFKKLLEQQRVPIFQKYGNNQIKALRVDERDLTALQSILPDQLSYIDKVHLFISSRIYNDHRVNQALENVDSKEREKIVALLTMLAGTKLTTLESRRLDQEKVEARKLLSRLAVTGENKIEKQLVLF